MSVSFCSEQPSGFYMCAKVNNKPKEIMLPNYLCTKTLGGKFDNQPKYEPTPRGKGKLLLDNTFIHWENVKSYKIFSMDKCCFGIFSR